MRFYSAALRINCHPEQWSERRTKGTLPLLRQWRDGKAHRNCCLQRRGSRPVLSHRLRGRRSPARQLSPSRDHDAHVLPGRVHGVRRPGRLAGSRRPGAVVCPQAGKDGRGLPYLSRQHCPSRVPHVRAEVASALAAYCRRSGGGSEAEISASWRLPERVTPWQVRSTRKNWQR